jgi:hypothetical protein
VKCHELKTWPNFLDAVIAGRKTFEVRKSDRDFQVGDRLHLRGWDPGTQQYNGFEHTLVVTYVMQGGQFGVEAGHVVLGFKPFQFEATRQSTEESTP